MKPPSQRAKSSHRRSLPLFLYDLRAANELLPPAAVLPEQFYSPPANSDKAHGEVALMRAVLEDALNCFQKQSASSGRRAQRLAKEAEEWLFTDDYHWPFSFVNICAVLGLDAEYVRRGLERWRQTSFARPEKGRQRGVPSEHRPFRIAA